MRIRSGPAGFCVTAAIGAMVTAGFSWVTVLLGWSISTLIMLLLPMRRNDTGQGPPAVTLLMAVLAMTAAALGAEGAFPEDSTFPFVSAMLLLILWRALCGRRRGLQGTVTVLGMILLPVLGVVLLFGLGDVQWRENLPAASPWFQVYVAVAAASPWWCLDLEKRTGRTWLWYGASGLMSLGLSLLTHGTLGGTLASVERFPLYRAVQTVRILGALQRMEALVAAVVLMGGFGVLLMLGELAADSLKALPGKSDRRKTAAVLLTVFLLEWMFRALSGPAERVVETAFWVLTPVFALWVVFLTKPTENA